MKKAIIVPYVVDQGCPSKPENVLISIPDDKAERDELLRTEYAKYFDCDEGTDLGIVDQDNVYSDLYISNGDCFLLFTFINC